MTIAWHQHGAALLLAITDIVVRGMRLQGIAPISFRQAVRINAYGDAAAAVTPARLGGEPARFTGFRQEGIDTARIVSALGIELVADWLLVVGTGVWLALAFGGEGLDVLPRLVDTLRAPGTRWLAAIAVVIGGLGVIAIARGWGRLPTRLRSPLAEALRHTRDLPARRWAAVAALTLASIGARIAILPVLAASMGPARGGGGTTALGSFIVTFGQHVLPAPGGAVAVELMFMAGYAGATAADVATLVLVWRGYAFMVGAGLGVLLALERVRRRVRVGSA